MLCPCGSKQSAVARTHHHPFASVLNSHPCVGPSLCECTGVLLRIYNPYSASYVRRWLLCAARLDFSQRGEYRPRAAGGGASLRLGACSGQRTARWGASAGFADAQHGTLPEILSRLDRIRHARGACISAAFTHGHARPSCVRAAPLFARTHHHPDTTHGSCLCNPCTRRGPTTLRCTWRYQ